VVLNLPVCTLVLVSFFQSIPRDLENAAMIDGCTRLGALWRVVVPLAAPGVFTAGILSFVNAWDEFLLALSLNSSASMRTLPVGITLYQGEFTFPWPIISAALIVAIVPIAVLIAVFQERVVGGLTQAASRADPALQWTRSATASSAAAAWAANTSRTCARWAVPSSPRWPTRTQAAARKPRRCSTARAACSSATRTLLASGLCDAWWWPVPTSPMPR
jgi:ABC-type Fe3+ transport system permease subunit